MKNQLRNKLGRTLRQNEAAARAIEYAALTPQQKIKGLDLKLGAGVGAVKQRARLAIALTKNAPPVSAANAVATFNEAPKKKTGKKARRAKTAV